MQRDIAFSASFNVLYLVDSEKSVTHRCIAADLFTYAREAPCISINKGSPIVLFAGFFVPLQKIYKKENKIKINPQN